ncbi:MAG: hypothetical protein AYK19_19735 [Theionarchaea archaeon DG-70-1]|nr:MAG: hypothetical protein AYK19_19735 [Theionarchaea archaeon DG-70-1]
MPSDTVTISRKEYEELIETLEVLSDQDLMKRINKSLQEFSQGKVSLLKKPRRDLEMKNDLFSASFTASFQRSGEVG